MYFYGEPSPGWTIYKWTASVPQDPLEFNQVYIFRNKSVSATAEFVPAAKLTWESVAVGGSDDAKPPCIGYCTANPALAYYGGSSVVRVSAAPKTGYEFSHWEGTATAWTSATGSSGSWSVSGAGQDLQGMTASTIYVRMGDGLAQPKPTDRHLIAVYERANCGDGKYGLNMNRAELDSHFPNDTIRAIAWHESKPYDHYSDYNGGWLQFYCSGGVVHSGPQAGPHGNATGMMMIIPSQHVGTSYPGYDPVILGSECSGDGIAGDQLYNLGVGYQYYLRCTTNATDIYPEGITDEQIEKDALAKYKEGIGIGKYWDRNDLANGVFTRIGGFGADYADDVLAMKAAAPWEGALICPCPKE